MHPVDGTLKPIFNPYTAKFEAHDFRNIAEHSVCVALATLRIATQLVATENLEINQLRELARRALLHDLNKPYEILRLRYFRETRPAKETGPAALESRRRLKTEHSDPFQLQLSQGAPISKFQSKLAQEIHDAYELYRSVYSTPAYQLIADEMPSAALADLANEVNLAGIETGHGSLHKLITVNDQGDIQLVPGFLAEKIVHLADDMTLSTKPQNTSECINTFLTPWERMVSAGFLHPSHGYHWLWLVGLTHTDNAWLESPAPLEASSEENSGLLKSYSKRFSSFAELQLRCALLLCSELKAQIAPYSPTPGDLLVKELILKPSTTILSSIL